MRKTNRKATGHCFRTSYEQLMNLKSPDARLVHGIVWSELTGWHVHGWVELNGFCFDHGNIFPQDKYYQTGKVKTGVGEIFKYTKQEAVKKSLKVGKYYFSNLPCNK